MPGDHYTPAEYALQLIAECFSNFLFPLEEQCLTHTYWVVLSICELKNIDYLVLQYLNTGAVPFEESS